jgi:ADP-heptose:LPS heptosyltransferase
MPPDCRNKINPKNYPKESWIEVISLLSDYPVFQVGIPGEELLPGIHGSNIGLKVMDLKDVIRGSLTWISVDNFFPHLANIVGKPGVVIFGRSDPKIFGYPCNTNLLKDEKYLREKQFEMWFNEEYIKDAFIEPKKVVKAVKKLIKQEV